MDLHRFETHLKNARSLPDDTMICSCYWSRSCNVCESRRVGTRATREAPRDAALSARSGDSGPPRAGRRAHRPSSTHALCPSRSHSNHQLDVPGLHPSPTKSHLALFVALQHFAPFAFAFLRSPSLLDTPLVDVESPLRRDFHYAKFRTPPFSQPQTACEFGNTPHTNLCDWSR